MKYARCPNCNGRLGIPNKKRGRPVTCPKCSTEFVAPTHLDNDSGEQAIGSSSSSDLSAPAPVPKKPSKKPALRGLPMPGAIATKEKIVEEVVASDDPMMPPTKKSLASIAPAARLNPNPLDPPPMRKVSPEVETEVVEAAAVQSAPAPKAIPKRSVAKIVQMEIVQPQLGKDGKLPTLHLNDTVDEKPKEEKKMNPAVLAAVICSSLLCSGLMLLMLGGESTEKHERIEKTREAIRTYYEIRPDQDFKPYQIDLRQAQLAHSRDDYATEIRAYETIMKRFRSEDLSEYAGLTGSPTADIELQQWVSVLLSEAKRLSKR